MGFRFRIAPKARELAARLTAPVHVVWRGRAGSEARRMLGTIGFWIAQPSMDAACRRQLVALQRSRRATAKAAVARRQLELQIAGLVQEPDQPEHSGRRMTGQGHVNAGGQVAELYRLHANLKATEERAAAVSRQLTVEINAFRTGMEAARAAYTAAEETARAVRHA